MHENQIANESRRPRRGIALQLSRWLDGAVFEVLNEALAGGAGRLHVTLPSGATAALGLPGAPCAASLAFRSYGALWRMVRGGSLGFAECYMSGDIETDDLRALFEFYIANERSLTARLPALAVSRRRDRISHRARRNTLAGSRRNIAAHYDLGNEFYSLWLDATMSYSSAIYTDDSMSLAEAQQIKIDRVLSALELQPGHSLLEIGCGWGALAESAAKVGAKVDAITISEQQRAAASQRIAAAGLERRVEIRFEDYRQTAATYDRLVSIEMIEAVGEDNWPRYFATIADRLAPGGVGVVQAITIRESAFEDYRRNPDFIQRYIFPGGMLPTVELMRDRAAEAGLEFEIVQRFGSSYARTLREWRSRFEAAWPRIASLGFDERFRRMWLYYLIYCEVGFEQGMIDVGLYRLRKAG